MSATPTSSSDTRGGKRKRLRIVTVELRSGIERAFRVYVQPITMVKKFKYLGCI